MTKTCSSYKEETIETELSKGILVCANCHREVHYGFHPEYLLK
jgi:predicted HNH restriction endonuclease